MSLTVKNARTSITGIKTECFVNGVNLPLMDMIRLNGNGMTKIQNLIHADASFRRSVRVRNNYGYFDSERIRTNEGRAEMERLTERDDKGNLLFNGKQVYAGDFYEAVSCLEEYEDTGLTPPEIMELKERDTAKAPKHAPTGYGMICPICGNLVQVWDKYCGGCGQRLK